MTTPDQASIAELSARFSGVLLGPDQSGYDEARRIHNGMFVRRPALIARCLGTADVADAVDSPAPTTWIWPCAAAVITSPARPSAKAG